MDTGITTENLLTKIRNRVEECFVKAERFYGEKIPRAEIKFDLTGTKGGTSHYAKKLLRFNRKLAVENEQEYMESVIPHEVSHHVTRWRHGYNGIKSHGNEWKHSMIKIFGISPKRTHAMDVSSVRRKTREYQWSCLCPGRVYNVGLIKHKKLLRNNCVCQKCLTNLRFSCKGSPDKPSLLKETELD